MKATASATNNAWYNNYGAYFAAKRTASGVLTTPAYTSVEKGAYYTDAAGAFVKDDSFNYTSRGAKTMNEVEIFAATVDFNPFEWMSGRYVYQRDHSVYNSIEGITTPYADGQYWSTNGSASAGYYRETEMHTVDLIFSYDIFGVKNKILTGYTRSNWTQQYNANDPAVGRWYGHVPGINNAIANPGGAAATLGGSGGQVPSGAVVRERDGTIKTPSQVYTRFDPGFDIYPDISQIFPADRSVLDGYKTSLSAAYVNWQANLLDERLDVIAGFRRETRKNLGQHAIPTYPWVITPWNAYQDTVQYPTSAYGYGPSYQQGEVGEQEGDSWMGGASFAVTKEINVYASVSKTFKFNSGLKSGTDIPAATLVYASALAHGGGSYVYKGQTITSVTQAIAVHSAEGAFDLVPNESGKNIEFGAKIATDDNKIVGTVSFFRGERTDQRLDDAAHQSNAEEPLNRSTTLFGVGTLGYNARNFRWRTTDLKNRIEGAEAEIIWTPMRNYQAVINGSWLWTAKTVYDKTRAAPGSAAYQAYDLTTVGGNNAKYNADIYYGARIENVPEYRLNMFHKYTFTDGPVRGASIGLGIRYSSETVISRSLDWNPLAGGAQSGDFLVFDVTASYPWEIAGYKIKSSLGIYNATDKVYMEGRNVTSPARNFLFTNTVSF